MQHSSCAEDGLKRGQIISSAIGAGASRNGKDLAKGAGQPQPQPMFSVHPLLRRLRRIVTRTATRQLKGFSVRFNPTS